MGKLGAGYGAGLQAPAFLRLRLFPGFAVLLISVFKVSGDDSHPRAVWNFYVSGAAIRCDFQWFCFKKEKSGA